MENSNRKNRDRLNVKDDTQEFEWIGKGDDNKPKHIKLSEMDNAYLQNAFTTTEARLGKCLYELQQALNKYELQKNILDKIKSTAEKRGITLNLTAKNVYRESKKIVKEKIEN